MPSDPAAPRAQRASGEAIRVSSVLETCLYASALEPTARFYEEVLGLRAFARLPGRHVFFRVDGGVFLLFDPSATSRAGSEVPPHGAHGPGHIAFAVPETDLDLWLDRLRGHGIELEADVRWPGGGRSLYIRDPANNSVEIATPKIWSLPDPPHGDG